MACCPQRTVQNIDKYKQKNAEIRRYSTVSGRVTSQCCLTQCSLPIITGVTITNCQANGHPTYNTRCDYTVQYSNGTSFQWYWVESAVTQQLSDGNNITGTQTPTITLNTSNTDTCAITSLFCIVSNSCGSSTSPNAIENGGCPQANDP